MITYISSAYSFIFEMSEVLKRKEIVVEVNIFKDYDATLR